MTAAIAGVRAFAGSMAQTSSDEPAGSDGTWDAYESRLLRYRINRAFYDGTAYSEGHPWSPSFKTQHRAYRHIRPVRNPCQRLGRFYIAHLWGGGLDDLAGDGKARPSAIPIECEPANRKAIEAGVARLWKDSRWAVNKDIASGYCAIEGDVGFRVLDDRNRGQIRLEVVPPSHLAWFEPDAQNNVRAYEIRYRRPDPRLPAWPPAGDRTKPRATVVYREIVTRDKDIVRYLTLLNDQPFAWNGESPSWEVPLGFVPLTVSHFEPVGLAWGANCFAGAMRKIVEADGLGSGLTDQINKAIRNPTVYTGCKAADFPKPPERRFDQHGNLIDDQDSLDAVCIDRQGVGVHTRTFDLDIPGARSHLEDQCRSIEADYPELRTDPGAMMGTPTAEAIRAAKANSAGNVRRFRTGLDDALARAQMMALTIGGRAYRDSEDPRYKPYAPFDLGSYADGTAVHRIGDRPVFAEDEVERLDRQAKQMALVAGYVAAKWPLIDACEEAGISSDRIKKLKANLAREAEATDGRNPGGQPPQGGEGEGEAEG